MVPQVPGGEPNASSDLCSGHCIKQSSSSPRRTRLSSTTSSHLPEYPHSTLGESGKRGIFDQVGWEQTGRGENGGRPLLVHSLPDPTLISKVRRLEEAPEGA